MSTKWGPGPSVVGMGSEWPQMVLVGTRTSWEAKRGNQRDACKLSSAQEGCLGTEEQVVQGPLS